MPNWKDVLDEIQRHHQQFSIQAQTFSIQASQGVDVVRRQYLKKLQTHTKRNIIAYYSGFLSKPGISQSEINDEDKNGFMMAVHKLDRKIGLDLILHTPGGNLAATQSIVNYLHIMFEHNVRAIIPQIAMSAGTMMACSCKSIVLSKHSNLGPIDPHLSGVPAYGVIQEFRRACREVKRDASKIPIWRSIVGQYRPTFLSQCENAIRWSNSFVEDQLSKVMFSGDPKATEKSRRIVKKLSDYRGNKGHDRHIHIDECEAMGLKIEKLEDDPNFQDLVLTVHHCYMHSLMNTNSFKIIENHLGTAFVKQAPVKVQS